MVKHQIVCYMLWEKDQETTFFVLFNEKRWYIYTHVKIKS